MAGGTPAWLCCAGLGQLYEVAEYVLAYGGALLGVELHAIEVVSLEGCAVGVAVVGGGCGVAAKLGCVAVYVI